MKLKRVRRLDNMTLTPAYFTPEGYLRDRPIVTTCGIFEYENEDGSIRRELRLPEEVFAPESLKSYEGKPIIVTHNAGEITKDNVSREQIGTILGAGIKDGDNVRVDIIIHDSKQLNRGFRELSLGYDADMEESPGTWNGQHTVTVPRAYQVSKTVKKTRVLPDCKFTARLAGAIHVVEVSGKLEN